MTYRRPPRVAFVEAAPGTEAVEPTVYLMRLPDGPPLRLEGTAALIWLLAADGEPDVAAAVADTVGEPLEAVAQATQEYLDYLLRAGLLAPDEPDAGASDA